VSRRPSPQDGEQPSPCWCSVTETFMSTAGVRRAISLLQRYDQWGISGFEVVRAGWRGKRRRAESRSQRTNCPWLPTRRNSNQGPLKGCDTSESATKAMVRLRDWPYSGPAMKRLILFSIRAAAILLTLCIASAHETETTRWDHLQTRFGGHPGCPDGQSCDGIVEYRVLT
jgi:hypothetical protein